MRWYEPCSMINIYQSLLICKIIIALACHLRFLLDMVFCSFFESEKKGMSSMEMFTFSLTEVHEPFNGHNLNYFSF